MKRTRLEDTLVAVAWLALMVLATILNCTEGHRP